MKYPEDKYENMHSKLLSMQIEWKVSKYNQVICFKIVC